MADSKKSLDTIVDLVIPTYNRPDFLRRIMDYYQETGASFNLIVADSSNKTNKRLNKKIINSYPDLKVRYIDEFPDTLTLHLKLTKTVKYILSKYCVFCADDDFIIPKAIRESVAFLEKNPDYSAAHGIYLGYHFFSIPFITKKFLWKIRYSPYTIANVSSLDRVDTHMQNYILVLWAVRRTVIVKKIYAEFNKLDIDPYLLPVLGELIPDVLTVVSGKVKAFKAAYGVRQYFGSISSYFPSLLDAKKAGRYQKGYSSFKKCLIKNLPKENKHNIDKVAETIDLAMEKYINYSYGEHFINKVNLILRHFPKFVSQVIRQIHTIYLFSKNENGFMAKLNNSSKSLRDFNIIKKSIIKSDI